ncbi:hypothetical protein ACHQM5_003069 [Ranunculus cassubicifolius]
MAFTTNQSIPSTQVIEKEETTLETAPSKEDISSLKENPENLESQQFSTSSPATTRNAVEEDKFATLQKAFEKCDKLFFRSSSPIEKKDDTFDPSTCVQANDRRGGLCPLSSKRKRGSAGDALQKANGTPSTSSEVKELETSHAASQTQVDLVSQGPVWTPEFFLGGNPRMGPLKADQSALTNEVAVGLIHGSRLPADIAHFAQCKDSWEIYSHVAKCLAGVIGGTTELQNRATRQCSSRIEVDKPHPTSSRLEQAFACKKSDVEESQKKINTQAKKIADQASNIAGLISSQKRMKDTLKEKDTELKMVREQCNQLQHETKEQEDAHVVKIANLREQYEKKLAHDKFLTAQASVKCILNILGVSTDIYQTKYKAMLQENRAQMDLNPEAYSSLIPFLDLDYEADGEKVEAE